MERLSFGLKLGEEPKTIPLVITFMWFYVIMYAINSISSILLIVPVVNILSFVLPIVSFIYLAVTYCMALPLVVEKDLHPWQALEISRKAISQRWFTVFSLLMLIGLINCVGAKFFGVGLIWTLPFSWIAFGILYRNMFGCEAATLSG